MIKNGLKLVQRRLYTFLNTWSGFTIFLVLSYVLVVVLFGFVTDTCRLRGLYTRCSPRPEADNIGFVSLDEQLTFQPFDVVYTWVNGSDPRWKAKKDIWTAALAESTIQNRGNTTHLTVGNTTISDVGNNSTVSNSTGTDPDDTMSLNRYRDSEELRFSLRSLVKNAPWIRHIYIVTDNQIPYWLNLESKKLTVVSHEEIFANKSHLPVFSSPAIEANLHRILGLSKKFIYFNDDVFLGMKVLPEDFISLRGAQRLVMSWDVPKCAPGCSDTWIGDGFCDKACNVSACNFDFPDCVNGTNALQHGGYNANARPSSSQAMCTKGCPDNWLGDKICDQRCKNEECGWDVGDCGLDLVTLSYPGVAIDRSNARIVAAQDASESFTYGVGDYQYGPGDAFMNGEFLDELQGGSSAEVVDAAAIAGTTETAESSGNNSTAHGVNVTDANSTVTALSDRYSHSHSASAAAPKLPPALTVEYGTKAVYFDLAYLPCMHSNNATCIPSQVGSFLYERAEHDDDEGKVVHSASILSKHHILVVLLYYGQEGAPEPSWEFFDVKFTLYPLNTATSESHTVTFSMRMVPPAPAHERHPGELVPKDMALLPYAPAHSCSPEGTSRSNANGTVATLSVSNVSVLVHPYRELQHGVSGIAEEGALVTALLSAPSDAGLWDANANSAVVRYIVTNATGYAASRTMPLRDALMAFSPLPSPHFERASTAWAPCAQCSSRLRDLLHEADRNTAMFLQHVASRGPPRSPRFQPVPSEVPAAAQNVSEQAMVTAPQVSRQWVHLKLPMPFIWSSMAGPTWLHVRAELVLLPPHGDHTRQSAHWHPLPHSNHTAPALPTDAVVVGCIGAAVQWGSVPQHRNASTNSSAESLHTISNATDLALNATVLEEPVESVTVESVASVAAVEGVNSTSGEGRRRLRAPEYRTPASSIAEFFGVVSSWLMAPWRLLWGAPASHHDQHRRRLEDTYGQSLVHVNRIYNKEFGTEGRKVPAHVPHMIDRDYMQEMQTRWAPQWNATSSHRFRSPTDMQYSFSYYYYLINRHKVHPHDLKMYLSTVLDTNHDGCLDENEFRSVATMVKSSASPRDEDLVRMRECVVNSSSYRPTHTEEVVHSTSHGRVRKAFTMETHPTIAQVLNCTEIVDGLRKYINWNNMFPTHVLESDKDLVAFEMIGDNLTISLSQLDSVRARQSKFVCINDNMKNPPPELERALRLFYESFFPEPCVFELPPGQRNPTLYLDEYRALKAERSGGLQRIERLLSDLYRSTVQALWKGVRNALVSAAYGTIDSLAEGDQETDKTVGALRHEIHRPPRPASTEESGSGAAALSHIVLYVSVAGVVAFVLMRQLLKWERRLEAEGKAVADVQPPPQQGERIASHSQSGTSPGSKSSKGSKANK